MKGLYSKEKTALVLSGGGARGAYQVGVLSAIGESLGTSSKGCPFGTLVGASAGSINAGALAAVADNYRLGTRGLEKTWRNIQPDHVFRTDLRSLGTISIQWMKDLSLGGILGRTAQSLLDTAPLRKLLVETFPFHRISSMITKGHIEALAISATNIRTTNSVTFVQDKGHLPLWSRFKRVAERGPIGVDHLMASSAVPLFFPPVKIGSCYFADGCLRNVAPLSPAIHLGAENILTVSVRAHEEISEDMADHQTKSDIGEIVGVLMNAVFMDAIDMDIERLHRMNKIMALIPKSEMNKHPWKPIKVLSISPSENIADIASEYSHRIPSFVRYLLKGLGTQETTNSISSYILFDSEFCSRLIQLGYKDGMAHKDQIKEFFDM